MIIKKEREGFGEAKFYSFSFISDLKKKSEINTWFKIEHWQQLENFTLSSTERTKSQVTAIRIDFSNVKGHVLSIFNKNNYQAYPWRLGTRLFP